MKIRKLLLVVIVVLGLLLLAMGLFLFRLQPAQKDRVFLNGVVLTMDESDTVAEAVAAKGGRIVAVGDDAMVRKFIDSGTRVVDLAGKTMVPGFVDGHSHFPGSGAYMIWADLNSPPIGKIHDMEELKAALRTWVEKKGSSDWVIGFGYDDTMLAERRHPTREDLDEVSESNPIWIHHISGHLGVANSAALALAGIDENTEDPEGGRIWRDPATGIPTGVLEENAVDLVEDIVPRPSLREIFRVLRAASKDYVSKGITTAQNGLAGKEFLESLSMASKLRILPLRIVVWPDAHEVGREILEGTYDVSGLESDRFTVGAMKFLADGSIQGYTGYLTESYYVIPPDKPAGYRGYARIPREVLAQEITRFQKGGFQVAVHCNGDAALDNFIYAIEQAQTAYPRQDLRPIVVHAQVVREDQLDKMKTLGMTPSFFSLHTYYWGDRHMNIFLGPERAKRIDPARSAVERNMRFSIHTDTPVVPMDPMRLMWSAVNRISDQGTSIGEAQRISPLQALRACTIDAAWQNHLEDTRGSIEVGKFADLAILSENPLENPEGIKDIRVLETIMDGRTVFSGTQP